MVKKYKIVGKTSHYNHVENWIEYSNLHETDCYNSAKGFVSSLVSQHLGIERTGYEAIIIQDAYAHRSQFDQYGWTHY